MPATLAAFPLKNGRANRPEIPLTFTGSGTHCSAGSGRETRKAVPLSGSLVASIRP